MSKARTHLPPLILFAGLALLWTWPLPLHLSTHVPGPPGDNFSFLWNLWWMREALRSGVGFFHSTFLMYPFGVDLVNHPHTALQGLISATVLSTLSVIEAENLYILTSVFLNAAAAYALAFDLTHHRRAALLCAVAFGSSPYLGAHILGHFDLMSAWVLPAFMLCLRRALRGTAPWSAAGCGLVLAIAAYTAYYHMVYLALMAIVYTIADLDALRFSITPRTRSAATARAAQAAAVLLCLDALVMTWILLTGGTTLNAAGTAISVRDIHNPLTLAWLLAILWASTRWRVRVGWQPPSKARGNRTLRVAFVVIGVFALCAGPLILEGIRLGAAGRYMSPEYFWRSAPRGVDPLAAFVGNPSHPLMGPMVQRVYNAAGFDRIEAVGWVGLVPLALLLVPRGEWLDHEEARRWKAVLAVGALWALGPFLTIAGFDVGLPLPQVLMRFVPVVANARMPGRAMVIVYTALAVLMALRLAAPAGRWKRTPAQWVLIGLLAFDFLYAPLPLIALGSPAVYERLARADDAGAVIEVPFGIGDGLTRGIGDQDRSILFYATLHGHPLVGGFIGRMPPGVVEEYQRMPIVGNLLRLSAGQPRVPDDRGSTIPFRYMVLNTRTASNELTAYVRSALTLELLAADDGRELLAVHGMR